MTSRPTAPILNITSAEPESGKSTTLGLIKFLAPRCLPSVEISEAALYRSIELWQPSFAIDEFDTVLASDDKAALRSIINSGHTRGQGVVKLGVELDFRPQHFKTFCPEVHRDGRSVNFRRPQMSRRHRGRATPTQTGRTHRALHS